MKKQRGIGEYLDGAPGIGSMPSREAIERIKSEARAVSTMPSVMPCEYYDEGDTPMGLVHAVATEEELIALDITGMADGHMVLVGDGSGGYRRLAFGYWQNPGPGNLLPPIRDGAMPVPDGYALGTRIWYGPPLPEPGGALFEVVGAPQLGKRWIALEASEHSSIAASLEKTNATAVKRVHNEGATGLVNHPVHYNTHPVCEAIDVIEHMSFNVGNAVKYLWRAGIKEKQPKQQDLNKALWYLKRETKRFATLDAGLGYEGYAASVDKTVIRLVLAVARHPETSPVLGRVLLGLVQSGYLPNDYSSVRSHMAAIENAESVLYEAGATPE